MPTLRAIDRPGSTGGLLAKLPAPKPGAARTALPMSAKEMRQRGWDSGDAYIDHPSFTMAILGPLSGRTGRIDSDFSGSMLFFEKCTYS